MYQPFNFIYEKNLTKIFLGGFWTISSDLYKIHIVNSFLRNLNR
ncbi:hypothetical protein CLW00_1183 [Mongoliibacter ruber]|uniref:Uncharacterized protein n=1 Tax=Mongoliibacter ruber TaxID=1750599 RepID=A0A2T0WD35_9BACT|nr:hypothetical protein CLW00_1183 [Mongoliibacter ruber]